MLGGCKGTLISGTGTAIGNGSANTTQIDNNCTTSGIAADICENLSSGGYSDWFLPSKDELNQMYNNKSTIGGFSSAFYWSSSEGISTNAWGQYFNSGSQSSNDKEDPYPIRCIRRY